MIEDVDMLGLDATVAGAGGGSQKKAESVVSAGERQSVTSTTAVKNNVPNGSQSDVLPAQVPKANVRTGCTANTSHRRRKQDDNFACTVPGWIHIYAWLLRSFLKDIYDPILKKNCINVIDLDVAKGLRDNMIVHVNDMNS